MLQDILKGLESCVVPNEWGTPDTLPCISSTAISDTATSTVPFTVPSAVLSADPSNGEDMALPHITAAVQPSDRRSSRFEAQVETKTETGAGTGTGNEAVDGPLMRRLAEDFMYVPTMIPDYRCIMTCLSLTTAHPVMMRHDRLCVHHDPILAYRILSHLVLLILTLSLSNRSFNHKRSYSVSYLLVLYL